VNDNVLEYPDEMHGEPCGIEILLLPIRLTVRLSLSFQRMPLVNSALFSVRVFDVAS
jgi:hypothetical protein